MEDQVFVAFHDWHNGLAYIDGNGNYHVRCSDSRNGPIALWNKTIKRLYNSVDDFHMAVQRYFGR